MLRLGHAPRWLALEVCLRDCWVGLFWQWKSTNYWTRHGRITRELHVYVCLVPCLPLHLIWGCLVPEEDVL